MTTKTFTLGKGYTHFAIDKKSGLIITGWDYKGYIHSDLMECKKDYFYMDLIDLEFNPKQCTIVTRAKLIKTVDVKISANWYKSQNDVQSNEITANEIKSLIINNGLTITNVIDNVIELNGIIGVGLISLGDRLKEYCWNKCK